MCEWVSLVIKVFTQILGLTHTRGVVRVLFVTVVRKKRFRLSLKKKLKAQNIVINESLVINYLALIKEIQILEYKFNRQY